MQSLSYDACPYTLQLEPIWPSVSNVRKREREQSHFRQLFTEHRQTHQNIMQKDSGDSSGPEKYFLFCMIFFNIFIYDFILYLHILFCTILYTRTALRSTQMAPNQTMQCRWPQFSLASKLPLAATIYTAKLRAMLVAVACFHSLVTIPVHNI